MSLNANQFYNLMKEHKLDLTGIPLPNTPDLEVELCATISPKLEVPISQVFEIIATIDEVIESRRLIMERLDEYLTLEQGALPDAGDLVLSNKKIELKHHLQTPDCCVINIIHDLNTEYVVEEFDIEERTVVIRQLEGEEDRFIIPYSMFVDGTFSKEPTNRGQS